MKYFKEIQFMKKLIIILKKEENFLNDIKLCSRLIYYLCLNDPTNRFESRSIIVELSKKLMKILRKIVISSMDCSSTTWNDAFKYL